MCGLFSHCCPCPLIHTCTYICDHSLPSVLMWIEALKKSQTTSSGFVWVPLPFSAMDLCFQIAVIFEATSQAKLIMSDTGGAWWGWHHHLCRFPSDVMGGILLESFSFKQAANTQLPKHSHSPPQSTGWCFCKSYPQGWAVQEKLFCFIFL